jgi:AcrR family transcriptional regulator
MASAMLETVAEPARPPRPPRPATKREQRQASLARLGEAALELFVAQGYRQTPVEQMGARRA